VWLEPTCLIPTEDNARNPRPTDPSVIELGKSLSIVQLNAVQARPHPHMVGVFDLRAGCRRRAAAEAAGIPIRVDLYDWDDEAAFTVTMAENHEREDLTVLEEAKLCAVCLERYSVEDSADRLGHSAKWIRRRAALSRLTEEARAFGTDEWTISYWEALAVLEPEAQREAVAGLDRFSRGAEDVSLADIRRACKAQTRSLGTKGLWPLDHPWPKGTCADCAKRKLALASLPGFEPEGTDECLDGKCYDQRLQEWTRQRVAELRKEAEAGAPVLVDSRMRGVVKGKGVTDQVWKYHEQQTSYSRKPVQVIVACAGPPRIETRYVSEERPAPGQTAGKGSGADRETLQRWRTIRTAVQALQEHLGAAATGEESPIALSGFEETWHRRRNNSAFTLLPIAVAAFGLNMQAKDWRRDGYAKPQRTDPKFGDGSPSPWQPIDCFARPGAEETTDQCLDRAFEHLFRDLCRTFQSRLRIDTLKGDADNALAEAKTICEFLGLDWQAQYATPAGLEPERTKRPKAKRKKARSSITQEVWRERADKMDATVEAKLNALANCTSPTPRRVRQALHSMEQGETLLRVQGAMRGMADAIASDSLPEALAGIGTKAQIETILRLAELPTGDDNEDALRLRAMGIDTADAYAEVRSALLGVLPPPDPERERRKRIAIAEADLVGTKIPGFFPTPAPVIERMLEEAEIEGCMTVLEPSAGKGDIVEAIQAAAPYAVVLTGERNQTLRSILELKGCEPFADFLEWGGSVQRIVMNPPFEKGQDIVHVRHAYDRLRPGGRLVSIMSEGPFFREGKADREFRIWLDLVGGRSEKLPEDSFKSAFRSTSVATRLVVIDMPEDGEEG
jgi:ParB/RepB/Spo0J family partition protein